LFGLNEFAGFVTSLAMQKPGFDVRKKILPHHVFQLQCVVDSFVASRGWTVNALRGHVVSQPPPRYYPRRDVDLFLDREVKRTGHGIIQATDVVRQLLKKNVESKDLDTKTYDYLELLLEDLQFNFINWLGESKYMFGLTTIEPSRFSFHNANGLWEYSPFLCSSGMIEGIVLAQRVTMMMWDRLWEPTLAIHLHNMLVKQGHLRKPVGLYWTLEGFMEKAFYANGVPERNFWDHLLQQTQQRNRQMSVSERRQLSRDPTKDIHDLLDVGLNTFFNIKSALMMYYDANWVPDRIPSQCLSFPSMLFMLRLGESVKPTSSELSGHNELIKTLKDHGADVEDMIAAASHIMDVSARGNEDDDDMDAVLQQFEEYKSKQPAPKMNPYNVKKHQRDNIQGRDLLNLVRYDIFADVCGKKPMSGLNYLSITMHMIMLFMSIEDRLKESQHPLYSRTYGNTATSSRGSKRAALITAIIAEEDTGALKLCAEVFEKFRVGAIPNVFWGDLREEESGGPKERDADEIPMDQCLVM
jgi:hypothetical protein